MLDGIRALVAFEKTGTVSEAASQLRLTQSAVSKRIQALEDELSYKLVETDGRKLKLTSKALLFLAKAKPLLLELENLKFIDSAPQYAEFSIGISDSIASSWGPSLLKQALAATKNIELNMHVHRSTLVLERLRLGQYELGLVAGHPVGNDLVWSHLADESMVLVGSKSHKTEKVLAIEPVSATWKEIGQTCLQHPQLKRKEFVYVESFFAAAQLAREGFGQALVPAGVAKVARFKKSDTVALIPNVTRQIQFVTRKSIHDLKAIAGLIASMKSIGRTLV